MGNTLSSSDVSESALTRTADSDNQLLSHYLTTSSSLTDAAVVSAIYRECVSGVGQQGSSSATALGSWLFPLNHEKQYVKQAKIRRKLEDTAALLQIRPDHSDARQRYLKCLQRTSHFLVNNVDPHAHLMHERVALLQRYFLAFNRQLKREEIAAITSGIEPEANNKSIRTEEKPPESFQDKQAFIELLFARSLDEYESDPNSPIQPTTFVTPDEFVGQLLSILTDNLPSERTFEEELELMEQQQADPNMIIEESKYPPVSMFGVTGLMGMPFASPSAIAAKKEESLVEEQEPKIEENEDDASFALRLHSYTENRKLERKKKQEKLTALRKKKRELKEAKAKVKESQEQQNKLRRINTAEVDTSQDPDSSLPPEAHFASLQMLELLLDESKRLTLQAIETAQQEYQEFKTKKDENKPQDDAATASESSEANADSHKKDETAASSTSSTIYPLSSFPATHFFFFLFRDLMRKAALCTNNQQRTIKQLHYVLKRVLEASKEILHASEPLLQLSLNESEQWTAFEKQVKYETVGAGALHELFVSCANQPSVPNAPAAPASSSSSSSSASSSVASAASNQAAPVAQTASASAPLISTLLSTSLLTHSAFPALSFIWSLLWKPVVFDNINNDQIVIKGSMENPAPDAADSESEQKEEEKTNDNSAGPSFNLFTVLLSFLSDLDHYNSLLQSTKMEEIISERISNSAMTDAASNQLSVVVETPHTYFADSEDQQVVYIPNASYLIVEFDPRCSTERNRDHLTITVPADNSAAELGFAIAQPPQKVAGPFHGPRDQWPKMPIVIQNTNTLVFNFHSDQANNSSTYFGYRALVTGYSHTHELVAPPGTDANSKEELQYSFKGVVSTIMQNNNPKAGKVPKITLSSTRPFYFLYDLEQSVAHIVGRILHKETIGATPVKPALPAPKRPNEANGAAVAAAAAAVAAGGAQPQSPTAGTAAAAPKPAALDDEQVLAKYLNSPLFYSADVEEGEEEPDSIDDGNANVAGASPEGSDSKRERAEEAAFETRFLQDFIEAKAGTIGFQLDTLFKKQLQSKRVDQLGGAIVKRVVRQFIAVMLKHLGLTKMAAYYLLHKGIKVDGISLPTSTTETVKQDTSLSTSLSVFSNTTDDLKPARPSPTHVSIAPQSESDWAALGDQLLELWKKGQNMHQVIVSGKQLAQQALDNLIAEEETAAKMKAISRESAANAPVAASSSSSSSSPAAASSSSVPLNPTPNSVEARVSMTAREKAEKLATYEGWTESLSEKCEYLLSIHSFAHHPLSTFAEMVNPATTATPSLDMATEVIDQLAVAKSDSTQENPIQSLKSLLNLYHTAQHFSAYKEQKVQLRQTAHRYFQTLTDLISNFVRDEVPLATIRRIRDKQVERAKRRANAMEQLLSLLKALKLKSTHIVLLKQYGPPFRQYVSYPMGPEDDMGSIVGGHYYNSIEASGKKHRQRVHDSFNRLYTYLIHQLRDAQQPPRSIAFQALVLDMLCMDWHATVRENSWIVKHQLLPLLDGIIKPDVIPTTTTVAEFLPPQESELSPFQLLAVNLFRFLAMNSLNPQLRAHPSASKGKKAFKKAQDGDSDEKEEKALVVSGEEEKQPIDSSDEKIDASDDSAVAPKIAIDPFAFLTTPDCINGHSLDTLQQSVLDRLVASLQHSASLLSALRKSGGDSVIDSEVLDINLTPEQKQLLYRRKNRPSASSSVSSASAQERQAQMAGLIVDDDSGNAAADDGDLDIEFGDAHPSFPLIRRYLYLEQQSYESLSLLASIASPQHNKSFLQYLCTPSIVRTVLLVFVSGSPRMQSVSVRLLAQILPLVSAFQLREHALYDYLVKLDKDERFGAAKKPEAVISTPSSVSASSTPFSSALRQSYMEAPLDTFSLGDALPQPQTLALSRSSSLQARRETDAILSGDDSEEALDKQESQKFVSFFFKKLADLLLATATTEDASGAFRPTTPLAGSTPSSIGSFFGSPAIGSGAVPGKSKHLNPLEYRDGQMKQILASELIMLIRTLHKPNHESASPDSNEFLCHRDWSTAIQSFLTSHLLSLSKLVERDQPRIAGPSMKNDVGLTLASLSVIGGHTEILRVGGLAQTNKKSSHKEVGVLISVDRSCNRCKVLFADSPNRIIDCDLSKLVPIDSVAASSNLVQLNSQLLHAFQVFTAALEIEENERLRVEAELEKKKKEKAERQELERLQRQFEEEEAKLNDPFGGFRDELADKWPCPTCTFENPIVKPSCELCGSENPNFFIKKQVVEEEEDEDDIGLQVERITLTNEHLLYYQLRSKALKALCVLLQSPQSMLLLFQSGQSSQSIMPSLVAMAIRPTHLDVFKSISTLEDTENRLVELISESSMGLVQDHLRFNRRSQGTELKFSPFKNLQIHLPSALDVGSARSMSFVGDRESLCEVKYNGGSALSSGLIRANFLVPNSLPAYYFEVTVVSLGSPAIPSSGALATPRSGSSSPHLTPQLVRKSSPVLRALASPSLRQSSGGSPTLTATPTTSNTSAITSSAFDVAVGLFRCGMPLEGLPGKHSTYAYSARNGEFHSTRSKLVMRERVFPAFKAGDTIGCGVHVQSGQRMIFFTKNGVLVKAQELHKDEMDSLDLGPTALDSSRRSATFITSKSGIDANLSGRFYAAVWMENQNAQVKVNFGQSPFRYDFAKEVLPYDYRLKLEAMEKSQADGGGKKLSAVEMKRRTMAEDLMELMGNFPIEICVLALERNNDDKAAAGDWLFTSGAKALEQMAQEALRSQEEKKRQAGRGAAQDDGDSSGDEDEDLAIYLAGGDASNQHAARENRNRENMNNFLDDEVDVDIPLGLDLAPRQQLQQQAAQRGGRGNPEVERQRERARQLLQMRGRGNLGEDELENLLAQVMGLGAGASSEEDTSAVSEPIIYENIKLDEIEPGQTLVVSPAAVRLTANQHGWMAYFAGRSGVVTGVNINAALVTLIFHDVASAVKRCASFPVQVLQKPQRMWLDPCRDLWEKAMEAREKAKQKDKSGASDDKNVSISWQDLAHEFVQIEKALSVQKVRRAVLRCIATWPRSIQFDVQHLSGPDGVLAILKLTAAQYLSSSYKKQQSSAAESHGESVDGANNLLDAFKAKLIQLVESEGQLLLQAGEAERKAFIQAPLLRITEKVYNADLNNPAPTKKDAASVKSASSASSSAAPSHQGYSSASENVSEMSEDDAASIGSARRSVPFSASERVNEDEEHVDDDEEGEDYEDDRASAADSYQDRDPDDEEDDGEGSEYDEEVEVFGDQGEAVDFDRYLHELGAAAGHNAFGGGGQGFGGNRMFGQGFARAPGNGGYGYGQYGQDRPVGRSSAPPISRTKKKKKTDAEKKDQSHLASLDEKLQQLLQQPRGNASSASSSSASATSVGRLVSPLLVEECLVHFIQSINHGPPIKTFRSAHPYPAHTEKRGRVQIGGASKLLVRFDPRCQIGTDMMTRLSFYRDQNYQDLIVSLQGSGAGPDRVFPPFIVEGDRLYYKFSSGSNFDNWGYKFRVEPIDLRINDSAALLGRNAELSGWLLDLFLTHFPALFQYSYITELYNAVVWYVIHAKPSMKSRGVESLVRLLFHLRSLIQKEQAARGAQKAFVEVVPAPAKGSALGMLSEIKQTTVLPASAIPAAASSASFPFTLNGVPDFKKLHSLAQQMDSVLDSMGLSHAPPAGFGRQYYQRSLQSPTMLGLVELLSTVDLLSNEFDVYQQIKVTDGSAELVRVAKEKSPPVAIVSLPTSSSSSSSGDGIDLIEQFHDRLRVDKAHLMYRVSPNDKTAVKSKDITESIAKYLSWQNDVQLLFPTDPKELEKIPGFEGEIGVSQQAQSGSSSAANKKPVYHKLHLTYSILTPHWNPATQQLEAKVSKTLTKSIPLQSSHRPTLIKPTSSRFENVVNMSRLTLEMKNANKQNAAPARLPSEFLLESYRLHFIQKNYLQLVGEKPFESTPGKWRLTKASPSAGVHNGTRSYSVSFWMYLNSNTVPPASQPNFRYILHTGNLPEQSASNMNYGAVWPTSGFSVGLGHKDQMLHCMFFEPSGSNPIHVQTRSAIQAKRWTAITVIVTDGVDVNVYIDGSIEITHKCHHPLPALSTDPFHVGSLPAGMLKLFRHQNRANNPENPVVEDPYRLGLGFPGSIKDMRLYSYDVDASTFVPAMQESAKKYDKERTNKNNFFVPVGKPALATKKEVQEVLGQSTPANQSNPSFSLSSSSSSSTSSSSSASVVWTPAMDIQLMEVFTNVVQMIRNKRPADQPEDEEDEDGRRPHREPFVHLLDLPLSSKSVQAAFRDPALLRSANLLTHIPHDVLKQRFCTIQLLNAKLIDVLPFIDFTQSQNPWSLAHRLSNISWLILLEVKSRAWKTLLASTGNGQPVNITVNRPRALKARERGTDPDSLKSIWGQVFQQMHFLRPAQLRIQTGNRPFRVKLMGEGAIDAGGPGREILYAMSNDLMSRDTPLFLPAPNSSGFGDFGSTWVPNPKSVTSLHQSMYSFVGKFLGMAIRGGYVLNLDLHPFIWRRIVSAPISRDDLQDVNALAYKTLEQYGSPTLTKEQFDELPVQKFVTMSTDGREVELKDNGANLTVTHENRFEYVRLEEQYRLHEFDLAISCIKKGLGTIVPVQLLSLFTPSELETMVCGNRDIDVEILKRMTEYQRVRPSDAHIKFFWTVVEEMTQKERQLLLRFVSGQSRLWSEADQSTKFKIMPSVVDNDNILPISHTCFHSLEVPRYSSAVVMRNKLLYAINNCTAIDGDTVADNLNWDEE